MCLTFLYTNPDAETGQFRLILASNRDEQFKRPAKQAHFWEEFPAILGGRDMEPGREGGTWFAMSKKGRISALMNIMGASSANVKGRGWIIPEYLNADSSAEQHLSYLKDNAHEYNFFNLLAVDVRIDGIDVHQISNVGDTRKMSTSGSGFFGIGNHWIGRPTCKVSTGLTRFKDVVGKLGRVEEKDELLEQLLALLKWDKKHYPDPVLESLAPNASQERLQTISSVYINNPEIAYGTRTHTIVLIDNDNKVDFFEWTMAEPIQQSNPQWLKQHYSFQLECDK